MKFKSSAVDLTTFLAPRILSEGLFLYLGGKKGGNSASRKIILFENLFKARQYRLAVGIGN